MYLNQNEGRVVVIVLSYENKCSTRIDEAVKSIRNFQNCEKNLKTNIRATDSNLFINRTNVA